MITRKELIERLEREGLAWRELRSPAGWAVAVPALGAKVLGAGVDEENLLWTSPELAAGGWCVGGQRTWLAPEGGPQGLFYRRDPAEWTVPAALDPGGWREIAAGSEACVCRAAVRLQGVDGREHALGLERDIRLGHGPAAGPGPAALQVRVIQRLQEEPGDAAAGAVGLWSILQAPNEAGGIVLVPLAGASPGGGPPPEGAAYRPYFGELPPEVARLHDGLLRLRCSGGSRWKIGLSPRQAAGLLVLLHPSRIDRGRTLAAKSFTVHPEAPYLDAPPHLYGTPGDAVQVYNHFASGPAGFTELEAHAPAGAAALEVLLSFDKGGPGSIQRAGESLLGRDIPPDLLLPER